MAPNKVPKLVRRELAGYANTLRYLDHKTSQDVTQNIVHKFLKQNDEYSPTESSSENGLDDSLDDRWPCPAPQLSHERWTIEDEVPVLIRSALEKMVSVDGLGAPHNVDRSGGMLKFHEVTDEMAQHHSAALKVRLESILDVLARSRPPSAPEMQRRFHPLSWWHVIDILRGTNMEPRILDRVEQRLTSILGDRQSKYQGSFEPNPSSQKLDTYWEKNFPDPNSFGRRKQLLGNLLQQYGEDSIFDLPLKSERGHLDPCVPGACSPLLIQTHISSQADDATSNVPAGGDSRRISAQIEFQQNTDD